MTTNTKHFEIIRHMLGMNNKRRQEWGQRNYFASYKDGTEFQTLQDMQRAGLVSLGTVSPSGMHYFHVTEKGLAYVGMRRAGNGYLIPLDEEATA
jgi:DNA-binding PadR family transcriptional regulator